MPDLTCKEYANQLRCVADFIEAHPEIGVPIPVKFSIFPHLRGADVRAHAASTVHAFGKVTKEEYGSEIQVVGNVNGVVLEVWYPRDEICERVELERRIVPAKPEETIVRPATPEHEEIVYGWKCAPILKSAGASA